jgi:8-oxo-dGTP diphosphatase
LSRWTYAKVSFFKDNHKLPWVGSVAAKRAFVLALLYTMDGRHVVLMKRTRPLWQNGRVNGLGGGILEGETPAGAARREVREECGVDVPEWTEVLVWEDAEYRMHVMRAMSSRASEARTLEDQEVFLASVDALPANVIDNLKWLVPLALDRDVAMPIGVKSAAPEGSGLTDRDRAEERA